MKSVLRMVVIIVFVGLGVEPDAGQAQLSPEEFAKFYMKEFRRQAPGAKLRLVGPMELKIKRPDGSEFRYFLGNGYKRYLADPTQRDQIIEQYVAASLEILRPDDKKIHVSRVVPVIKDVDYLRDIQKGTAERGTKWTKHKLPAHEPYNTDLVILYAEDSARNIRYLTEEDLNGLGLSKNLRRARAVENLSAMIPSVKAHGGNGIYMLTAAGTYESSLLLFDRIWRAGQLKVRGELVVAIPSRSLLLVTGSKDPSGIKKVREMAAEELAAAAYHLTHRLFVYRDGTFVRFDP